MSIFKFKNTRYTIQNTNRGFTFVELIVVIAIFSIMAGVVIFNARDFGDGIALQNLAQDIAMQLKKAQNDGSSGKQSPCFSAYSGSKPAYGIYFDASSSTTNKQFIYFADYDNSGFYDPGTSPACVGSTNSSETQKIFVIGKGDYISNICINNMQKCGQQEVHIIFKRPQLEAQIYVPYQSNVVYDTEIVVSSPNNKTKTIKVWPTGQISIE